MPHTIHPFAVMFWEGKYAVTYMAGEKETLLKMLKDVSPQRKILDLVLNWDDCKSKFATIGELVAFLKPDDYLFEQLSFF